MHQQTFCTKQAKGFLILIWDLNKYVYIGVEIIIDNKLELKIIRIP